MKPKRRTPDFIKNYSGWIMAVSCILVFWVEIVWTAYRDPYLTGAIILFIVLWSMVFSVLYSGRSWCRYVCPLGAVNAIFAMPAVVELRANSHVCMNRCQSHACFAGDDESDGCPMFRHPYLVDNNRDCIMCGKCVKSCDNSSIQVNVRLAPQELWALETPRLADSFLIVSLGAMFFPFVLDIEFSQLVNWLGSLLEQKGLVLADSFIGTVIFFATILFFQVGYYLMVTAQSVYAKLDKNELLSRFGYGFIPLMLGGYLAVYLDLFVLGAGKIVPNIQEVLGLPFSYEDVQLISSDSTIVLQIISILGGLLASLYATFRVMKRSLVGAPVTKRVLVIPFSFLIILACLFIYMV